MDDFDEKEHQEMLAYQRKLRREELAKDLLLKLVENRPGITRWDISINIQAAIEYTDGLLAALDEQEQPDEAKA
jgi:hypothetical protein